MAEIDNWRELAAAHKVKRLASIPKEWTLPESHLAELSGSGTTDAGRLLKLQAARKSGLLSTQEIDTTEGYSVRQLLKKIAKREIKAVEVATAFCKRAAVAQQLVSLG